MLSGYFYGIKDFVKTPDISVIVACSTANRNCSLRKFIRIKR